MSDWVARASSGAHPKYAGLIAEVLNQSPATRVGWAALLSLWCDKRLLEFWHRLRNMADTRIVKQVVSGACRAGGDGARRGGARRRTWLDHVADAMDEWGIDATRAC
jgi:hypothetical protein